MGRVNVRRVLVTPALEREVRQAVMRRLLDSEYYTDQEAREWIADAAVSAVKDHVPNNNVRHLDAACHAVNCPVRPTWRARATPTQDDPSGGVWLGACGVHLSRVLGEITHGERMELDVDRIRSNER